MNRTKRRFVLPALRRCAMTLALCCGSGATAQAADVLSVIGQPVLALAQRPELTTGLRFNSGGHRAALAARLRDAGPPVTLVEDHLLQGWACQASGCRDGGVFLAYDRRDDRMYLMLTENGSVRLSVPPDPRGWPEALRAGVADFVPALAAAIGTRQ
jgi:hypothetical protein